MYCVTPCRMEITDLQGRPFDQKMSSVIGCVSGLFGGNRGRGGSDIYDWNLGMRGTMAINMHANRLGLNHWDILVGIVPWIQACLREGLISDFDGMPFDWNSTDFWYAFLDSIAYRTGTGDALAEGGYPRCGKPQYRGRNYPQILQRLGLFRSLGWTRSIRQSYCLPILDCQCLALDDGYP